MDRGEITMLLSAVRTGDRTAESRLVQLLYPELHQIAARLMRRERPGHTLQTTALLHQAYVRMAEHGDFDWANRAHFLGVAAQIMRNILIDHARAKHAARRGGPHQHKVDLEVAVNLPAGEFEKLLAIDQALTRLADNDERAARILEGHYFGGMTVGELSVYFDISESTVKRNLSYAKAWVYQQLAPGAPNA